MQDLTEKITEQFIVRILSGQWIVDEWLPSERALAEEFQVGRPTIHSVLIRLQEIGLVEIVPRHGVKVMNFLMNGKIGAVEIIIELFRNEIPEEMKQSLYKFICDNLNAVVENCLRAGLKNKSILPSMNDEDKAFAFNNKEIFSQIVFNFYQALAVETKNMIYPLLINSLKNGITNAVSYVKDKESLYEKMIFLEKSIFDGNFEQAHYLNHDIFLCVYNDWK